MSSIYPIEQCNKIDDLDRGDPDIYVNIVFQEELHNEGNKPQTQ